MSLSWTLELSQWLWPQGFSLYHPGSFSTWNATIDYQKEAGGQLQLGCSQTLPISQITGVEEEQMVAPLRAGRDRSLD